MSTLGGPATRHFNDNLLSYRVAPANGCRRLRVGGPSDSYRPRRAFRSSNDEQMPKSISLTRIESERHPNDLSHLQLGRQKNVAKYVAAHPIERALVTKSVIVARVLLDGLDARSFPWYEAFRGLIHCRHMILRQRWRCHCGITYGPSARHKDDEECSQFKECRGHASSEVRQHR